MALFRFANHTTHGGYEIRNVKAELVNGLPTPDAGMTGRFVYNTANNRYYVCENGAWGLTATNADALAGQTLAQVRDFAQTTGVRPATAISDFDTQVRTSRLDQFAVPTADVSFNSRKLTNLLAGTSANDAVNKAQLDAVSAVANAAAVGIAVKQSVRAVSTTNITLSGTQTIDGVSLIATNRVLVAGQTTASTNGIYVVAAGAWSRATDADTTGELAPGTMVAVTEGTTNADTLWGLVSDAAITIGTTSQTWAKILSGAASGFTVAGNGLTSSGGTVSVQAGLGIIADGSSTRIDTSVVARLYETVVPNGTATQTITHNLNNDSVHVQVIEISSGDLVQVGATVTGVNTVSIEFGAAVSTNQYRVLVIG